MKPVLIGQARRSGASFFAGVLGARIEKMAGIEPGSLRDHFDLRDLVKGDQKTVHMAAMRLRGELDDRRLVLIGWPVATAFGVRNNFYDMLEWYERGDGLNFAVFPHPTGVSSWYNLEVNRAAAVAFLRALVGADHVRPAE